MTFSCYDVLEIVCAIIIIIIIIFYTLSSKDPEG